MDDAFANALLALALEFSRFQRATATATTKVTSADRQIMRPELRSSFAVTAALNGKALSRQPNLLCSAVPIEALELLTARACA